MESIKKLLETGNHNFVFLGEAGSGKSEIAINFALYLKKNSSREVHFFDMDMTKPLFRSRDVCRQLEAEGIQCHFEEQFMDAPTLVGGVKALLRNENCYVVMDVGGDHIGARSIGGFMPGINRCHTVIYYVLNAFRPWSCDIEHIDGTLSEILGVSHIEIGELHMINNPNFGYSTTAAEVLEGCERMSGMVSSYIPIDFSCVQEGLLEQVRQNQEIQWMPLHLYLSYPWLTEQAE